MRLSLRPADDRRADALLTSARASELSYPEVGASLAPELPAGYHHEIRRVAVGNGEHAFQRGREALRTWKAHEAAGIRVMPPDAGPRAGTTVVLQLRTLGMYVFAACRIVAVVEEPRRFGVAYGTLTMHPASGEELFLVEWADDDAVSFVIRAFSVPRHPLARLGAPMTHFIQKRTTDKYVAGVRSFVKGVP